MSKLTTLAVAAAMLLGCTQSSQADNMASASTIFFGYAGKHGYAAEWRLPDNTVCVSTQPYTDTAEGSTTVCDFSKRRE